MDKLKKYRQVLDDIDDQIVALLNKRMDVAATLANVKIDHDIPIKVSEREKEIIQRLKKRAQNTLLKDEIESIFNPIFDLAKTLCYLKKKKTVPFKNFGIIGLGLIGGSIQKALQMKSDNLTISTLDKEDDKKLLELIQNADCIILATPINKVQIYAKKISKLAKQLKKKLVVIDVASVKKNITSLFYDLTNDFVEFVATHPLSGSEKNGKIYSRARLFVNNPWIITPHKKNDKKTVTKIEEFIAFLGAKTIILDSIEHDKIAALISHVPCEISKSYFEYVKAVFPKFSKLQGPGFLSFTRLGKSNPLMRKQIAQNNKEQIKRVLHDWLEQIKEDIR